MEILERQHGLEAVPAMRGHTRIDTTETYAQPGSSSERHKSSTKQLGGPNGIRTRVYSPPRAFLTVSGSYVLLTQHPAPRDSNSEGVLISAGTLRKALTPHAGDVEEAQPTASLRLSSRALLSLWGCGRDVGSGVTIRAR